jgi:hypothetical protein
MARGVDLSNVETVISYDAPAYPKTYIHRFEPGLVEPPNSLTLLLLDLVVLGGPVPMERSTP